MNIEKLEKYLNEENLTDEQVIDSLIEMENTKEYFYQKIKLKIKNANPIDEFLEETTLGTIVKAFKEFNTISLLLGKIGERYMANNVPEKLDKLYKSVLADNKQIQFILAVLKKYIIRELGLDLA